MDRNGGLHKTNELLEQILESRTLETVEKISSYQVSTREKPSPKLEKALEYLRENPDAMSETTRSLSALLGISHTYIAKAKRIIEGE